MQHFVCQNNQMYRVLLKVHQIKLHIKEPVVVEINIRKKERVLSLPNHFPLIEGLAVINTSYEFHISERNPFFELCIIVCLNGKKKEAGMLEINLKNLQKHRTMHIQDKLNKCPDKNSLIEFQFMFLESPIDYMSFELIGEDQVQLMKTMVQRSQMQEEKRELQNSNNFLEKQYKNLIQANKQLSLYLDKMQDQQGLLQIEHKEQIKIQQEKQNSCLDQIEREKHKLAEILDLVFQSGDAKLIQMIQEEIQTDVKQQ